MMNPYKGYQNRPLMRDATCALGPDDHAGFVSFSAKLWLPDRKKCANGPPKGPPILSPWKVRVWVWVFLICTCVCMCTYTCTYT